MQILSYNIQAAINSSSFVGYSYQWPKQILPTRSKSATLQRIAYFISKYDVVCLQEIELGGLRNGFKSQREQLLALTDFPYDLVQINRKLSRLSLHGNLILSRVPITEVLNSHLPGKIQGRGVLAGMVQIGSEKLVISDVHLSLGHEDQTLQLRFIRQQLADYENVLLCGDYNCRPDAPALRELKFHGYRELGDVNEPSFPSWKPRKRLDHAFLKGKLCGTSRVIDYRDSDHLPLLTEIERPR